MNLLREMTPTVNHSSNPIHILTIARLDWRNGHEFAIQAIHLLKGRGHAIQYSIVGDGEFLEAVAFARHELGLDDCVHLLLREDRERVAELLSQSDVFLLAAVAPDGDHALARAIQCDKTLVVTDLPQLQDLTKSISQKIHIVPRRDPVALANCLHKLITI